MLNSPHRFAPGGVFWSLAPEGVYIDGHSPVGTPGPPDTVRRVRSWFGTMIDAAANEFYVPALLLTAIVCNESAGGQPDRALVCTARREEPGWISDEATPSRVSTGCCQTLLSTARAVLRNTAMTSASLDDPNTSIRAAAAYILSTRNTHGFDPVLVAAVYNAGGLHLEDVAANRWKLRCYPLGSGIYIDRFLGWYNDAVAVAAAPS